MRGFNVFVNSVNSNYVSVGRLCMRPLYANVVLPHEPAGRRCQGGERVRPAEVLRLEEGGGLRHPEPGSGPNTGFIY